MAQINVVRFTIKATAPGGKDLKEIAALQEKLQPAIDTLAEALGITPDEIDVDARPVRALKTTA